MDCKKNIVNDNAFQDVESLLSDSEDNWIAGKNGKGDMIQLLQELCDLAYPQVQQKLNKYLQNVTHTKLSFIALVLSDSDEMVIHVIGEKILGRALRLPALNNILYDAAQNKNTVSADVKKLDEELLRHLQLMMGPMEMTSLLLIPIQHPKQHRIVLIVSLLLDHDIKIVNACNCTEIVEECFRFCLAYLLNSFKCYQENRLKRQCQDLLGVSRKLLTRLGDFSDLLREIMAEVKKLTNAERCSLFLLDLDQKDLVAKIFDGTAMKEVVKEMRIPFGKGIAGHVATTGKLLNIKNAYEHPLFYRGIDDATGFKTKSILCFPICDEKKIIGVAQLCNKMDMPYFDVSDEEIATSFSIYCGISIVHSIVYKKMQDAQARNKLSNEVMMYHMKVEEEAVEAVLNCKSDHNIEDFHMFHFSPRSVPYEHMPCYTIKMFNDLALIKYWEIKLPTLVRFILYVKKGYRDAPYHNWEHAFSVTHFAYLLMRNLNLITENYMTHLEALVFLVSCLCHDLDHRGTNNSFQTQCGTVLASLYSSEGSVMERHHLAQSMCILNTEDCNIFESFTSEEYSAALNLLRSNILATDLAAHLRAVEDQDKMVKKKYNKNDPKEQKFFLNMLMTCCDLSDQTKSWRVSKKTAEQIYDEFFSQGDLEKSMGNAPIEMMDRERASIPNLQVEFINNVALPLFINLATLFPAMQPLVHVLQENRDLWEISKGIFHKYREKGMQRMDILLDPDVEEEVLDFYTKNRNNSPR